MLKIDLMKKQTNPIFLKPRNNSSEKVYLFTNARDEKYIAEWTAHHLLLGFDAIFIFDHKSVIPIKNIFNKNKRIIIKRCIKDGGIKLTLMKMAVQISKTIKADWFLYLDCDEYLCLNSFPNVKSMLNTFNYADSLAINWVMFGSCNYDNDPGPLMENYTKSRKTIDQHVKSFVRPEQVVNILNPHYFVIYNPLRMFAVTGNQLKPPYSFNDIGLETDKTNAYIAHYVYQCKETYLKRKINLPRDDNGGMRDMDLGVLELYNDVDNFKLKNQYSENVKNKMKEIIKII
jgi:hypothetical protein